ncbi:MAG: pyrogallol hydroxytransferase large subunit, partial [Desulfobacterales bacterium]|nr:pyrogallol hydroxytransferase large subunit [Desulfobacterales bacterium]
MRKLLFFIILFSLEKMIRFMAKRHPTYNARLKEKNFTAQIKIQDNSQGRYFTFKDGQVTSKRGIHASPDLSMAFRSARLGVELLMPICLTFISERLAARFLPPPGPQLAMINAMKNFQLTMEAPDELFVWFSGTLNLILTAGIEYGTDLGNGVKRYTNNTNGGPVFVYVKEGKIIRITPIEFDGKDAKPWSIKARGKTFTPPRKTTVSPYILAWKSLVYSPDRLLYPMKRVDFDPNGERNCKNRGISGYKRISWDE